MILNLSSNDLFTSICTDSEMTELRRLKLREPSPSQANFDKDIITFIEIPIEKTDTLQGLSLKFGCTISQIKRLNNLAIDRDLFALSLCKIPIVEHSSQSALYEKELKRVHINDIFWLNNNRKPSDNVEEPEVYANSDSDTMTNDDQKPLLENSSDNAKLQKLEAILFFKNIDKDSEAIKENTNQFILEAMPSIKLNNDDQSNILAPNQPDSSLCNYKEFLIIAFIVLIVIPGVVFIYMRILNKVV